jgi:hypothetical protein
LREKMPPLGKRTARLLKTVRGQPYAGSEDHEEYSGRGKVTKKEWTEEELNADPISSDEEEAQVSRAVGKQLAGEEINAEPLSSDDEAGQTVSPPPSKSSQRSRSNKNTKAAKAGSKRNGRGTGIHIPQPGSYQKGKRRKTETVGEEEKENVGSVPTSSMEKKEAEQSLLWGMEYSGPKRVKREVVPTNIHAPPATYKSKQAVGRGTQKGKSLEDR